MWEQIIQFSISIFVVVLAGDLLYLYKKGRWYDPKKLIEKSEIIALWAFVIGGLINAIRLVRNLFKKER